MPLFVAWWGSGHGYKPPEYDELGDPVCTEKAPANPDCKKIP